MRDSELLEIFTVGHSTHDADAFVGLLRRCGVEAVADVRRYPGSRRMPWFEAAAMEKWLGEAGLAYVHLPELGGRRNPIPDSPNGGWKVGQFQGYADHMESGEFRTGMAQLIALARERPTAVMCAEGQWWRCHRRLISDALVARGWSVLHLDPRGRAEPHRLTEFAVVEGERVTYPPSQAALDL